MPAKNISFAIPSPNVRPMPWHNWHNDQRAICPTHQWGQLHSSRPKVDDREGARRRSKSVPPKMCPYMLLLGRVNSVERGVDASPCRYPQIVFRPRADGRRRAGDKRKPMPVPLKKISFTRRFNGGGRGGCFLMGIPGCPA